MRRCRIHGTASSTRRGFTLIEMIVLVIIIAVISSAIIPSYSRYRDRARFDQNVQHILELLSWARETAIQTNANSVVRFDHQSQMFTVVVEQPDSSGNTDQPAALQESQEAAQQAIQPRAISLGEDMNVIPLQSGSNSGSMSAGPGVNGQDLVFRDDGTSSGMQYAVAGTGNGQALINVNAVSGRATLVDTVNSW